MNRLLSLAVAATGTVLVATPILADDEVNLYSYRQEYLIQPMLDRFEEISGIHTNVVYADKGMLERLIAEGDNSPADAVLTVDIGRLIAHQNAGVLQPIGSDVLSANIPAHLRDPDGYWFGLSVRARIFAYAEDRVDPARIATYEALADPELDYRVCTRSSTNVYMQSLMASIIAHEGEDAATAWAEGVVANLGREPQGNDRAQVRAIAAGECDVAVLNNYYIAYMLADPEQSQWMEGVGILFPDQDDRGTHINISGAAVTRSSKNRDNAIALIEFLSSYEAQVLYADRNNEYPVHPDVPVSDVLAQWGDFKADTIPLAEIARFSTTASRAYDRAGYK